ncbi:hypothetical protein [Halorussus amylolyticus]|uniref:hypothetical protein n=1 Tax=Halorussus amylolyticus TaxID=1126242 RepID=UPI001042BCB6|nr:hypothetical protein [Halorussus amylolyticus]
MRARSVGLYRTLAAALAVAAILVVAHLVAHPVAEYGAWLAAFAIWMAWFVAAAHDWLSNADF